MFMMIWSYDSGDDKINDDNIMLKMTLITLIAVLMMVIYNGDKDDSDNNV